MALYQNRNSPLCPKLTLAHRLGPLDSGSKTVPRCWAADGEWNMGCSKSTAFPSFQTFSGLPEGPNGGYAVGHDLAVKSSHG